jgi:hypothetical protein
MKPKAEHTNIRTAASRVFTAMKSLSAIFKYHYPTNFGSSCSSIKCHRIPEQMGNEDSPCSGADQGSDVLHGNAGIILNVDGNSDELMILDYPDQVRNRDGRYQYFTPRWKLTCLKA